MATPPHVGEPPPAAPALGQAVGSCPRCGTAYDSLQQYCLECGLRLPRARAGAAATPFRRPDGPHATEWMWPVLVAALVAALATATVIVVRELDTDEPLPLLVGTEVSVAIPTSTTPTTTTPTETVPTAPTTTPTAPTVTQPPTTAPAPGQILTWPEGRDGWTIVLANLAEQGGRATATAKAKEAADAGLPEVGVLSSSRYSSLHPGYFVVFSGIYETRAQAEAAISTARANGYDSSYVRQIAS